MKRVFASPDSAELGLLEERSTEGGHPLRGDQRANGASDSSLPFQAELWVEREEDYGEAMALVEAWQHPTTAAKRCGRARAVANNWAASLANAGSAAPDETPVA